MKVRDFFILVIKLFGLYWLIQTLLTIFPQYIPILFYAELEIDALIWTLIILAGIIGLTVLLISAADKIVNLLKLEGNFSSDHIDSGKLEEGVIVKIASIILGGFMVLNKLPILIGETLTVIRQQNYMIEQNSENEFFWLSTLIQVIFGFYLFFNYNQIAKLVVKKEKPVEE